MPAEGFEIAQGFVSVIADVDRGAVRRSAADAGDQAGRVISEGAGKGFERSFPRDNRGRFMSAGKSGGDSMGGGLISGIASKGSALAGTMRGLVTSPHVLGVVAAAGAVMAPALMAGLSGGVMLAAGAGVIGLGYAIVKEEPAVKKASERLSKTTTSIFKKAAKPMIAPFAQAFGEVEGMMKRLEPKFQAMFKAMAPAIVPLTKGFTSLVENAMPGILKLIEASGPFMTEIAPSFGKIGEGISIFAREIAKAGPDAALFFKDLLSWIGGFIAGMGYFIGWVARGYGELRAFFVGIGPWVSNAYNAVSNWFSSVGAWFAGIGAKISGAYNSFIGFFRNLGTSIGNFVSGVGAWFAALPGRIGSGLAAAWNFVYQWGARIIGFFTSLPGRIGAFLVTLPGIIGNAFKAAMHAALFAVGFAIGSIIKFFIDLPGRARGAWNSFTSGVASTFNAAKARAISAATALVNGTVNFFRQLPGRARSAINSLIANVSSVFNSAKSRASSTASSLVSTAVNFLRALPGRARSAINSLISNVSSVFSSAASAARSRATALVNGAVSVIRGLPGRVRSALSSVRSAVTGAFSGAGSWLVSAGANIIRGLISGIRSMIGAAVSAAISGMKSIISGAKSALGISSPSKVAAREIGRWFMPGVARGVVKGLPAARRTVAAATRALVPAASAAVGGSRPGPSVTAANGTTYVFSAGSVVLDASKLKTIEDVVDLIGGIRTSARSRYARAASPAGA